MVRKYKTQKMKLDLEIIGDKLRSKRWCVIVDMIDSGKKAYETLDELTKKGYIDHYWMKECRCGAKTQAHWVVYLWFQQETTEGHVKVLLGGFTNIEITVVKRDPSKWKRQLQAENPLDEIFERGVDGGIDYSDVDDEIINMDIDEILEKVE